GEVITDVARLTGFVPADIAELIDVKRRAERQPLTAEQIAAWRPRLAAAIAEIDADAAGSPLPAEPPPAAVAAAGAGLGEVGRGRRGVARGAPAIVVVSARWAPGRSCCRR